MFLILTSPFCSVQRKALVNLNQFWIDSIINNSVQVRIIEAGKLRQLEDLPLFIPAHLKEAHKYFKAFSSNDERDNNGVI